MDTPAACPHPAPLHLFIRIVLLIASHALPSAASAQTTASGTIEGRVLNTRNGEFLENAHFTIEVTVLVVLTDSTGLYRFLNVPVGVTKVRAFFTGLEVLNETVVVTAGSVVQRDINLGDTGKTSADGKDSGTVKLAQFVVSASKEMDGAAIAINEQRFASNMVNVVSADEFGHVAEGNVGEFLKFVPDMAMDTAGGVSRSISIGGAPRTTGRSRSAGSAWPARPPAMQAAASSWNRFRSTTSRASKSFTRPPRSPPARRSPAASTWCRAERLNAPRRC